MVWIEDRRENLIAAPHAKEQIIESELALDADGVFLGFRTRIVGDAGAYSYNNASALIEPYLSAVLMPGVYRLRNLHYEVLAVLTNKAPVAPYRGVGWTAGHCARELLIDQAARELGLDPAEVRRAEIVRADEFPYESCTGMVYDSGSFQESLDTRSTLVDTRVFAPAGEGECGRPLPRHRRQPVRGADRLGHRGRAQASWAIASHDAARVTVEPSGEVRVAIGTPSQGQGHGTTSLSSPQNARGRSVLGVDDRERHGRDANLGGGHTRKPDRRRTRRRSAPRGDRGARAHPQDRGAAPRGRPADLVIVDGGVAVRDAPTRSVTLRILRGSVLPTRRPGCAPRA